MIAICLDTVEIQGTTTKTVPLVSIRLLLAHLKHANRVNGADP